jgi:hypothetical protein
MTTVQRLAQVPSFVGFPEEDSMNKARLLSSVAAALVLSAGIASAQDMKKEGAAPAPAAQQSAPAEKVAPNMKAGEKNADTHKAPATVGQAPKASDADKTRATDKGAMDKNAGGAKADADVKAKSDADVKSKSAAETKTPDSKAGATKSSETTSKDNAAQKASDSKASQSTTTGQGAAAGSAKLSTEQRTKITTIIKQQKVERVEPSKLNISISVGARIPDRGVRFYSLPQEVVVIYPEWRGYDYILVGDEIIVLDPRTHEIVAILEA